MGFNITTVDVWDTLLRRKCHPDEVKLASAKYAIFTYWNALDKEFRDQIRLFEIRRQVEVEIGTRSQSLGGDDEYELFDVWQTIFSKVSCAPTEHTIFSMATALVAYEVQFEKVISYADPGISTWLAKHSQGSELYFLSDFYITSEYLLEIIKEKHADIPIKGGLSSVSAGVNKRSGRLFNIFQQQIMTDKGVHMHVGDNPHSDLQVPKQLGINAKLYTYDIEEKKRHQLQRQFEKRMNGNMNDYWAELKQSLLIQKRRARTRQQRQQNLGIDFAPIFVLYVIFAIEEARKHGVECVYYFTREGEILKSIHEKILEANPLDNLPKSELLEVSRLSTFGPSLRDLSLPELNRIWTMYPRQSLRDFVISLGLQPEMIQKQADRAGLAIDRPIDRPWEDSRFLTLLSDEEFKSTILDNLATNRELIEKYLRQKGIEPESKKVVVVDIGWRGTIQDNLAKICPNIQWHGVYLALFKFLNPQPSNVTKSAFLFNDNLGGRREQSLSPQAPIEMLFNSEKGSVVGYRDGKTVTAERLVEPQENSVYVSFTRNFHEGVLLATPDIWKFMEQRALIAIDLAKQTRQMAVSYIASPPQEIAEAFFNLNHNETFGNGIFVQHRKTFPYKQLVRSHSIRSGLLLIREAAIKSGWPAGFYSANRLTWIQHLYNNYGLKTYRGLRSIYHAFTKPSQAQATIVEVLPKEKRIGPLLSKVCGVDLSDNARVIFNENHKNLRTADDKRLIINWLVPDFGYGSGGHMTIMRFARYFQSLGILNRIYVMDESAHATSENLKKFIEANLLPMDGVEVYPSSKDMQPADILISTFWLTAYEAFYIDKVNFKSYFIQDFEPYFYSMGSNWVFAEATYRFGYYGIAASRWLDQMMRRYGMKGCYFNLGYEPSVYYPDPLVTRDSNRILVYMRPLTERRGTELLIATLAKIKELRPETRIAIFGTTDLGYVDIPFDAEFLGLLNEEQLRKQHSSATITLLTSLTNYSLIPIEAMACGAVVVDVDVESMRETFCEDSHSPIVLAPPTPTDMANAVVNLLDDGDECRIRSESGLKFVKRFTWDYAFRNVENHLFEAYFGNISKTISPDTQLVRAEHGSKIYYVSNGVRYDIESYDLFLELGFKMDDVTEIPVKTMLTIPHGGSIDDLSAPMTDSKRYRI